MQGKKAAVLDVGGTKIMAGLAAPSRSLPRLDSVFEEPTRRGSREAARAQLFEILDRLRQAEKFSVISAAVPGPFDPKRGVLIRSPNLPGWENLPVRQWLSNRYGARVILENDANAAALAEARWGSGKKYRCVFYATISTGIGTGLVLDGNIYSGRTGMALEGGHLTIDHKGVLCACGLRGCIEAYASGTSLARRAKHAFPGHPEFWEPPAIEKVARKGNAAARRLIRETAGFVGIWLGNIINLLEPEVIVLGGGVTSFGRPFFETIREAAPRFSVNPCAGEIPIVPAKLKRQVGLYGAAAVLKS